MLSTTASLALTMLTTLVTPQQSDRGLPLVNASLQGMRDAGKLCLSLEGTDEIGNRPVNIRTDVFLRTKLETAPNSVWLEVISYENGRVSHRMVGDSINFYQYNVPAREYSVTPYAGNAARRDSVPINTLIQLASVHAQGAEVQALRLLNETMIGSVPMMKSWMPGVGPYEVQYGQDMNDPLIRGKIYRPRTGESVWVYTSAPKRTIAFWLGVGPTGQNLNYVQWTELAGTSFRPRTLQWTMTIYRDGDFSLADFRPWSGDQTRGWKAQASARTSG